MNLRKPAYERHRHASRCIHFWLVFIPEEKKFKDSDVFLEDPNQDLLQAQVTGEEISEMRDVKIAQISFAAIRTELSSNPESRSGSISVTTACVPRTLGYICYYYY